MNIDEWLVESTENLTKAGIDSARLDALVLLEDCLHIDRAKLLAHPEIKLSNRHKNVLKKQLITRRTHVPLAYIRGKAEFYGREFIINSSVLQPRPESEAMIDLLKVIISNHSDVIHERLTKTQKNRPTLTSNWIVNEPDWPTIDFRQHYSGILVADVGSGSGALGITAKLELPMLEVDLIEVDPDAINTSKMNVVLHTININVIRSNLLSKTVKDYIILPNLPYVPDGFKINKAASYEPKKAIFGGQDGLNVYRDFFIKFKNVENKPLYILTESFPDQHAALAKIARDSGYSVQDEVAFIQVFIAKKIQNTESHTE